MLTKAGFYRTDKKNILFLDDLPVHCIVLSIQVFFVESVCEDPDVIAQNIVVSFVSFYSSQWK